MGRRALLLLLVACRHDSAPLAETAFYRIELRPHAELALTALAGYHINERYPVKFIADDPAAIDGTGTFTRSDAQHGTLALAARAPRLSGTFKLSVCTDENCEIAEPHIAFDVR